MCPYCPLLFQFIQRNFENGHDIIRLFVVSGKFSLKLFK
jgi:hypothetical protein